MAATRVLLAGLIMAGIGRYFKEPQLSKSEIKYSFLSGALLMIANATVTYSEKWVSSGIAAVIIGAMPIWVMMFGPLFFGESWPGPRKILGALIGLVGVAFIASEQQTNAGAEQFAVFLVLASSWLWATGIHLQRKIAKTKSPFSYAGAQLFFGGLVVMLIAITTGEIFGFQISQVSSTSFWAWAYLTIFGSVVAFGAFSFLGRSVEPHALSTYTLVNPVIAVGLGWGLANEPVTLRFLFATALVLVGLSMLLFKTRICSQKLSSAHT